MIKALVLMVVINFNTQCEIIQLTAPKEEYTLTITNEDNKSPFKENVENGLLFSLSGSVYLLNELENEGSNSYSNTKTYLNTNIVSGSVN